MTKDEFQGLREGDIVRHKLGEKALIVTGNYGQHVVAVYTTELANPDEWILIQKAAASPIDQRQKGTG